MFLIGKKKELFNALGLVYGTVHVEGCQVFPLIDVETAQAALNDAVEKKMIEPEQAATIMEQISAAGVAPNLKAVFELAAQAVVPEGFEPSFRFVLHKDCAPLPHGHIVEPDEGESGPMMTLLEGLDFLTNWVADRDVPLHVLDGVYLMKEMIAAKLPVNEADSKAQYMALPQEVRAELEKSSPIRFSNMFSIPGLGDVMMVEIRLPGHRGQQPQAK